MTSKCIVSSLFVILLGVCPRCATPPENPCDFRAEERLRVAGYVYMINAHIRGSGEAGTYSGYIIDDEQAIISSVQARLIRNQPKIRPRSEFKAGRSGELVDPITNRPAKIYRVAVISISSDKAELSASWSAGSSGALAIFKFRCEKGHWEIEEKPDWLIGG
jgi:hypothetical protein